MENNQDLYEILGLKRSDNPTQDDIKKAFRKSSIKWHPDRWAGKTKEKQDEASRQFQLINQANQILSDEKKRRIYDQTGNIEQAERGQEGFDPFSMFTGGGFSFNGFDDIGEMFGFGSRRNSRQQSRSTVPGQDLQIKIKIKDISELFGKTKDGKDFSHKIRYKRKKRCIQCHGAGGTGEKLCPDCNGTGIKRITQRTAFGIFQETKPCDKCNGTGKIYDKTCKHCAGTGFTDETVEKTIVFHPGIQNGEAIIFNGEGSESKSPFGQNGRLIVIAQYDFDQEKYYVSGADVLERIEVPYEECILGSKIIFHHPDGTDMNITIPSLTPSGKRLMLKGRGLSVADQFGNNQTGDYILEIVYKLPNKLNTKEKKLLEEIKNNRASI